MATELYSKGNEAFVSEDYGEAVRLYTEAIDSSNPVCEDWYVSRSIAYIKRGQFSEALADAEAAIAIKESHPKAWLRKGIALYGLGRIADAKEVLQHATTLDQSVSAQASQYLEKCALVESNSAAEAAGTAELKVKYDWYQTESHVVISILIKNLRKDQLDVKLQSNTLNVALPLPNGDQWKLDVDLAHPVVPDSLQLKALTARVEIKFQKQEGIRWVSLNYRDDEAKLKRIETTTKPAHTAGATTGTEAKPPRYPSSYHGTAAHDWDKLEAEIKEEEKNEKPEGEAALQKMFQDIYANGTDETRKAMNKSFAESGGTVLSTNWKDIKKGKVDIKPPDGMEWKKW